MDPEPGLQETLDPTADALKAPGLDVVPFVARWQALGARLGVDFGHVTAALTQVPLCLRDPEHAVARREIARLIAEAQGAVLAALPDLVRRHLGALDRPVRHELMQAAVGPLVDEVLSAYAGLDLRLPGESLVTSVFGPATGVARRRRMNEEIGALRARLAAAHPGEDPRRTGLRLALVILGNDSLKGTLALSLAEVFQRAAGGPLRGAELPELPPRTGVPFIDRVATAEVEIAGRRLMPGDDLRIPLDGLEEAGREAERLQFFGTGAHACLGRPVSLALWREITGFLATLDRRVTVAGIEMRKNEVFRVPARLDVDVA